MLVCTLCADSQNTTYILIFYFLFLKVKIFSVLINQYGDDVSAKISKIIWYSDLDQILQNCFFCINVLTFSQHHILY